MTSFTTGREHPNPAHNDRANPPGGVSTSRSNAGPTATANTPLLQALSHHDQPVRIGIVVGSELLARFDELCAEVGWSRSRMFRKAMKSLLDGQIIQSDLEGRPR